METPERTPQVELELFFGCQLLTLRHRRAEGPRKIIYDNVAVSIPMQKLHRTSHSTTCVSEFFPPSESPSTNLYFYGDTLELMSQ